MYILLIACILIIPYLKRKISKNVSRETLKIFSLKKPYFIFLARFLLIEKIFCRPVWRVYMCDERFTHVYFAF